MADSTARSISAAVESAWNWRPSSTAIALKDAPSSSNSSRLETETRLPKSRCAMRRVPPELHQRHQAPLDLTAAQQQHAMPAQRIGPAEQPGEPCQRAQHLVFRLAQHQRPGGAANTSSRITGEAEETNGRLATAVSTQRNDSHLGSGLNDRVRLRDQLRLGGLEEHMARVVLDPDYGARRWQARRERAPQEFGADLADECSRQLAQAVQTPKHERPLETWFAVRRNE